MLSGIAGALYVPQVGIINPGEFSPAASIEIALWVAVGGRGTLAGAVIGALPGQHRQDLADRRRARGLAVLPRPAVHRRHPALPARRRRAWSPTSASAGARGWRTRQRRRGRGRDMSSGKDHHEAPHRDAALSRRRVGELRWLQGAQRAVAGDRPRRAAHRDRPQRRRQDDDDGRHHRQDAARRGHGDLRRRHRPHPARRSGDRQSRHRAQIPEADGVREPHRVRESRARRARQPRHLQDPAGQAQPHRPGAHRRNAGDHRSGRASPPPGPAR